MHRLHVTINHVEMVENRLHFSLILYFEIVMNTFVRVVNYIQAWGLKEMKTKVGGLGVKMLVKGCWYSSVYWWYSSNIRKREWPTRLVDVFDNVYERQKLKVNVNKMKVMVFERSNSEVVDFDGYKN